MKTLLPLLFLVSLMGCTVPPLPDSIVVTYQRSVPEVDRPEILRGLERAAWRASWSSLAPGLKEPVEVLVTSDMPIAPGHKTPASAYYVPGRIVIWAGNPDALVHELAHHMLHVTRGDLDPDHKDARWVNWNRMTKRTRW